MKKFLKNNWFKISLLLVVPLTALVIVFGLVIYPEQLRQQAKEREEIKAELAAAEAQRKEEERKENLQVCLEESSFQEQTAHLSTCGDPNIGKAPESCFTVFAGAKNTGEVIRSYDKEFPGELPELESLDDLETNYSERLEIVSSFWEKCNCGLEKYRRDELKEEKEYRDQQCQTLYSNNNS